MTTDLWMREIKFPWRKRLPRRVDSTALCPTEVSPQMLSSLGFTPESPGPHHLPPTLKLRMPASRWNLGRDGCGLEKMQFMSAGFMAKLKLQFIHESNWFVALQALLKGSAHTGCVTNVTRYCPELDSPGWIVQTGSHQILKARQGYREPAWCSGHDHGL